MTTETTTKRLCVHCKAPWTDEMTATAEKPGDVEVKCKCGQVVLTRTVTPAD